MIEAGSVTFSAELAERMTGPVPAAIIVVTDDERLALNKVTPSESEICTFKEILRSSVEHTIAPFQCAKRLGRKAMGQEVLVDPNVLEIKWEKGQASTTAVDFSGGLEQVWRTAQAGDGSEKAYEYHFMEGKCGYLSVSVTKMAMENRKTMEDGMKAAFGVAALLYDSNISRGGFRCLRMSVLYDGVEL